MTLSALVLAGTIVVPAQANRVTRFAAEELAAGLRRVTGEAYVVAEREPSTGLRYVVGGDPLHEAPWKTDEIRLVRQGDRIILTGDATRGPVYAVNEYLERVVGVRWWTKDEADYPSRPDFKPPSTLDIRYAPPFAYRETFYSDVLTDARFKVRMKCNVTSKTRYIVPPTEEAFVPPEMGGDHRLVFFKGRRSSYHSFFEVLPPSIYAKDHPDWYAEINGKRTGGGQLCVTNPDMQREYVKNTLALLRASPDCDSIQVSQNDDNGGICQCANCRAAFEAEGAWSGPYLAFANKVAEAIESEFPHVMVDTFAYQFTRKAPRTVRPRRNVLVRLCDIECAFNRPLDDCTYPANVAFARDLAAWRDVAAGHLYIWDYQADFRGYMLPHPNLQVFASNIRLFQAAGAVGVFEQGDAMCRGGDYAALKSYVTAHLLWNPSLDWKALADEFLTGYYGPAAAPHVKRALSIAEASATRAGVPAMGCFHFDPFPWITAEACRDGRAAMTAAIAADTAAGGAHVRRLRLAKLTWDQARIRGWREWKLEGDRLAEVNAWADALEEFKIVAHRETTTRKMLDDYLVELRSQP